MYRFIGEQDAYSFFNYMSSYAVYVATIFFFFFKRKSLGMFSRYISNLVSQFNNKLGNVVELVFAFLETYMISYLVEYASAYNRLFGSIVGTGANYFAEFIMILLFCTLSSILIVANPLKQLDISTLFAPIQLIFFKIACFCNGCCWGIPWEYGPYNHNPHHPGNQVPVQAMEIVLVLAIFIFLLVYRKKAKPGTLFPMYMILYSCGRFFIEFFKADYPNVLGPLKTYHLLSLISIVIGLIMFLLISKYGEKVSDLHERICEKFNVKIASYKETKAKKAEEENAKLEAEMLERLEKAKVARAKASVKHKK